MKKKFLSFVLVIFLSIPCFSLVGCNNNGDGEQDLNVQQAFSKFETVQDCMAGYNGSLCVDKVTQSFFGDNKEQMNTPGYWCETYAGGMGYNKNTGEFYSYEGYHGGVWLNYISKMFDDNQLGFFESEEGVLVDKAFGSHIIKKGLFVPYADNELGQTLFKNSILDNSDYNFTSYRACIKAFEQYKSENLDEYDIITYSVNAKKKNKNYIIEANIVVENFEDGYSGVIKREETYRYTFNDSFLLKFETTRERYSDSYDYENTTYTFEKRFSQEDYEKIDTSSYDLPRNKITQTLEIYRDCVPGLQWDMEYGTLISDYVDEVSAKANTKGYTAYIDAEHTIPLTNQVTKSYEPTNVYLLSIPEDDYAVAITRYIYEKTNGEREYEYVTSSVDCIVDYSIPDEPGVFKRYEFYEKVVHTQSEFYHEEFYVNGQLDDLQYDVRESGVYYFDLVHKQDTTPTVVNIYDSTTDKIWKSYTYYENGTLWSHIKEEIFANENYYRMSFDTVSVNFFQNGTNITNYEYLYVENGQLNIKMSITAESLSNLYKYVDLTDDSVVDRIYIYDISYEETKDFNLGDFETLIVNGLEFRVNGVVGNLDNITSEFIYNESAESLSIELTGGTFNIKFKLKDGISKSAYYQ